MFDTLDSRSPTPLYDQIASRIRVAVAAGELTEGDALPSVRRLAGQLRVNPATVVQAYRTLASDGFVEMKQGAGTFINSVPDVRKEAERESAVQKLVQQMLVDAQRLGLPRGAIIDAVKQEIGEE